MELFPLSPIVQTFFLSTPLAIYEWRMFQWLSPRLPICGMSAPPFLPCFSTLSRRPRRLRSLPEELFPFSSVTFNRSVGTSFFIQIAESRFDDLLASFPDTPLAAQWFPHLLFLHFSLLSRPYYPNKSDSSCSLSKPPPSLCLIRFGSLIFYPTISYSHPLCFSVFQRGLSTFPNQFGHLFFLFPLPFSLSLFCFFAFVDFSSVSASSLF